MSKTYKYSETFYSFQGEGKYTGIPTAWIRFFLCNLQCNGFGQDEPTNPDSWELPYELIDVKDITRVEDLPVFEKGCDSSYTWAKKYRHLMHDKSADDIADELLDLCPERSFTHPKTKQPVHMAFTGGEPMLKQSQLAMVDIMQKLYNRGEIPAYVTVETNGTKPLTEELENFVEDYIYDLGYEWFWSVSPKLWSTAGEKPSKAIQPEVVGSYAKLSKHGQLKFVVNGSDESWKEVEDNVEAFRAAGCNFPVYIMGVGGTLEGLKVSEADIAAEAIKRGYNYSSRVHVHVFGNLIGT